MPTQQANIEHFAKIDRFIQYLFAVSNIHADQENFIAALTGLMTYYNIKWEKWEPMDIDSHLASDTDEYFCEESNSLAMNNYAIFEALCKQCMDFSDGFGMEQIRMKEEFYANSGKRAKEITIYSSGKAA